MNDIKLKDIVFHNIAARYIINEKIDINIKEDKIVLDNYIQLLEISKKIYETLKSKKYSPEDLNKLIEQKNNLSNNFKLLTNIIWKL